MGMCCEKKDDDWVKKCMEYEVEGARPRDRPRKTCGEIVEKDCQARGLNSEDAMDHCRWMKRISDGHDRCEWVNVSSGTGSPSYKTVVYVCAVLPVHACSQWKFHKVALEMLLLLVRHDTRLPTSAVQLFVNNIVNSTINIRKVSRSFSASVQNTHTQSFYCCSGICPGLLG